MRSNPISSEWDGVREVRNVASYYCLGAEVPYLGLKNIRFLEADHISPRTNCEPQVFVHTSYVA